MTISSVLLLLLADRESKAEGHEGTAVGVVEKSMGGGDLSELS